MAVNGAYDLILLDLNLPEMDGFSILKGLQRDRPDPKVLILSANSALHGKPSGFSLGANDYLTKPFHFAELEVRIRVLLNRKFIQASPILSYEVLCLNILNRSAEIHGKPHFLYGKGVCHFGIFPSEYRAAHHTTGTH